VNQQSEQITPLDNPVVSVSGVSKYFCRDLKKSLQYGVTDIFRDLFLLNVLQRKTGKLREGEFHAIKDISFELYPGECLGLIGHNGAGKTTLLKMLNGLIKPDAGVITMRGQVGALIALGAGFNPILTGRENIYINAAVLGLNRKEVDGKIDEIITFSEIEEFIDSPVQSYSSGMQVRLGFAIATALEPDVLLVDEVLAVGDINFRMKCLSRIDELIRKGVTIILVSHSMVDIQRVCNKAIVMDHGEIIFCGDINKGVAKYEEIGICKQKNDETQNQLVEIRSSRIGTNVDLSAYDQLDIETGQDLYIEICLVVSESIMNPRLRIFLDTSRTGIISSLTSADRLRMRELKKGSNTISVKLCKIPFLIGSFSIGLSIHGDSWSQPLHPTTFATINVIGPDVRGGALTDAGIVSIESEWKASFGDYASGQV
jgi:homopolymeric O-antigen transport system ATP-binding protein